MAKDNFANEEFEREKSASEGDEYAHDLLVSDIRETLKNLGPPLSPLCCIYRVPTKLRRVNEVAYTPQVVSIGPFHHGKKTLKKMEKHKLRYLKKFLERAEKGLEYFVSAIKKSESRIRSCYLETFDHLNSDKFVKMILVDVGFIIELFMRINNRRLIDINDSLFLFKPWMRTYIQLDLILLENQLPFFVLEGLFELAFPYRSEEFPSFRELTSCYFSEYNNQGKFIPKEVKHFTDLVRSFQLPHSDSYYLPIQNDKFDHLYSATELHDAGVKFELSLSKCLLDIEFSKGVLKIPCLKLCDNTEPFIRNVMAFEQCHYPLKAYLCDYVLVMDYLINNAKDVDLLVRKKIIVNLLGDRGPVATLFNNLCKHIAEVDNSNYSKLCELLNGYYENRCHKWKAILYQEYFSTPWRIASIFAAFILLVLTFIQTIISR